MFLNKFYLNLNLGLISKGKKQTKSTAWPGPKPSPAGPTPFLSPFLFLPSPSGPTAGRAAHSSPRAPLTPPRVAAAWGPPVSCRLPPSAARCSICAAAASPHSSALLLHASSHRAQRSTASPSPYGRHLGSLLFPVPQWKRPARRRPTAPPGCEDASWTRAFKSWGRPSAARRTRTAPP